VAVRRGGTVERLNMTLARKSQSVARSRLTSAEDTTVSVQRGSNEPWEALGMDLMPVPPEKLRGVNKQYRGGLRVARVRSDGPAANQGIQSGDILVGMHKWETVSLENLDYILSQSEVQSGEPVKFYIVRGTSTLFGHIPVKFR
jgi:serine protease Do